MSLHGGSTSPPAKKKRAGIGGFKPAGGGGASSAPSRFTPPSSTGGSTYTPPSSGPSSSGGAPFGGFKFPGMGGPGGGGIWGKEPEGPGMTANWSESTRLLVAVGAFALILLAAGLLVFGVLKGGKAKPQTQSTSNVLTKFSPPTTSAGGKTQMSLTFTDGTTADLLYDPSLNLADLGVSVSDGGTLGSFARAGGQFEVDHGGPSFVANPTTVPTSGGIPGAGGATVFVRPAPSPTPGNYLDFKFGDWHVGVWEGSDNDLMAASDDASWAASMSGTVNPLGFLVLSAKAPLKLTPFGTPGGPSLTFGDIFGTGILLTPEACVAPTGDNVSNNANGVPVRITRNGSNHYAGDLCLKDVKMDALIYGSQDFVRSATDSLQIQNVKAGPAR